jgi:predicted MFS family arabinose efflux permease
MAAVSDALEDFESVPIGMGLCIMAVNFGMLVATPVFGWMVDKVGWSNTGYIFTVFPLIAIVLLCMFKEKSR